MMNNRLESRGGMKFIIFIFLLVLNITLKTTTISAENNLPELPPLEESPSVTPESTNNIRPSQSKSFFQTIKEFFTFKKDKTEEKIIIKNNTLENEEEPLIDLGENKLPTLESEDNNNEKLAEISNIVKEEDLPILDLPLKDSENMSSQAPSPSHPSAITELEKPIKDETAVESNSIEVPKLPESSQIPPSSAKQEGPKVEAENLQLPEVPELTAQTLPKDQVPPVATEINEPKIISKPQAQVIGEDSLINQDNTLSSTPKLALPSFTTPPPPINGPISNEANDERLESTESFDSTKFSPELTKFIIDEAKMLLLPNDEIVLGELSEQTKIDQMDFNSYITLYTSIQEKYNDSLKEQVIDNFIANYDTNFNKINVLSVKQAVNYAFDATLKNNISNLRVLLDNYPLLQKIDKRGYTLLHQAVESENYSLVKFLLMRGININSYNFKYMSALKLAELESIDSIANLIRAAGGK